MSNFRYMQQKLSIIINLIKSIFIHATHTPQLDLCGYSEPAIESATSNYCHREKEQVYRNEFQCEHDNSTAQTVDNSTSADLTSEQTCEQNRRTKILVAEDNPSNFRLLEVLLHNEFVLSRATDGEQAVEMFSSLHPDIVLMDIKMPNKDGYKALQDIREISETIPVIAVTAYAFDCDRQRALNAGFSEFIAKPLDIDELRRVINNALLSSPNK